VTRPKPSPLAVQQPEAARMLGMSVDSFQRQVAPEIRAVRLSGKLKLYPVRELERWLDDHAEHVLPSGSYNR
jgi:hypothetical protein